MKSIDNAPLVSIIMPAYNQARYVGEAIESVLRQSYPYWELVIVDDGSPDNVADIVKGYGDNRIQFYHTDNHGVSAARNFGIRHSHGSYILPLDADDKIAPTYVESCVNSFLSDPTITLVYCKWKWFGKAHHTPALEYKGYRSLLCENSIFCSAMFKREDFESTVGYDENIPYGYEDWEFWIRMLDGKSKVVQLQETLFYYRRTASSRSLSADIPERNRITMRYIYHHNREKYDKYFPDILTDLNELAYLRRRTEKWKHRSLASRLWKAIRAEL
ncbi:MAG: glycosyltransferase family 2 protein [Bacteroidales bacterium]|nr:glycosyltransferase family 2 protein [Bacteroidales bacterium]MBD5204559.1 glycosyltransferase family 2 protein [Bacteroidales bacterium]